MSSAEGQISAKDEPDLAGSDESTGGTRTESNLAGEQAGDGGASGEGKPALSYIPYALAGQQFTQWFNRNLSRLASPTVRVGTKVTTVVALHDDGRLELELTGENDKAERQFVVFEATYLDTLLKKFAASL